MADYIILVVVHITTAMLAFAAPMGLMGLVKRARANGDKAFVGACAEAERRGKWSGIGLALTLATGLGLIFYRGGFKAISANYHGALALIVVMMVLGLAVMDPAGKKLSAAAQSEGASGASIDPLLKRLGMGSMAMQLLWLVVLVLMFWRFGVPTV